RAGRMVEVGGGWWRCVPLLATAWLSSTTLHHPSPSSITQSKEIILATTTSTRDAGLLDSLLPVFERRTGYRVKVIAVGSGQALWKRAGLAGAPGGDWYV